MKWLRIILFPIVPIYFIVTWVRNLLYDIGWKSSKAYDFPVICVGNLSTGGTGKTPMVEYLVRLLSPDYNLATLSRGYGRKTKGFLLAKDNASAEKLGDEPFQIYLKFKEITVAVDEKRRHGIEVLRSLQPKPEVILLDDAFQHRKVKAGLNILLTAYEKLYVDDIPLPTGNLREPKSGAKRAQIVVVTKCPKHISEAQKLQIKEKLNLLPTQRLFFSHITYDSNVYNEDKELELTSLHKFTLVTGIANAKPLVEHLQTLNLEFRHLEFSDHHNFTFDELNTFSNDKLIVTTEKDYVRLKDIGPLQGKLFYLPIKIQLDQDADFDTVVKRFTKEV
ncbi:tetraacyldisaccharide 4'-kinase [Winogradskyella maritima]|uniref:Tetraacyldisaccharide 4'-kinase n=1 Tax=Winogradskyella maritima TaxID=1517766 RepID=A0ABV8AFV8_9FLAO|nr:tetraacyldisaccharide 4'-kinase [Winogradskyella maritima]